MRAVPHRTTQYPDEPEVQGEYSAASLLTRQAHFIPTRQGDALFFFHAGPGYSVTITLTRLRTCARGAALRIFGVQCPLAMTERSLHRSSEATPGSLEPSRSSGGPRFRSKTRSEKMPGQSWAGTVTDGSSWVWPEPEVWAVGEWISGYLGTSCILVQCGDDD